MVLASLCTTVLTLLQETRREPYGQNLAAGAKSRTDHFNQMAQLNVDLVLANDGASDRFP